MKKSLSESNVLKKESKVSSKRNFTSSPSVLSTKDDLKPISSHPQRHANAPTKIKRKAPKPPIERTSHDEKAKKVVKRDSLSPNSQKLVEKPKKKKRKAPMPPVSKATTYNLSPTIKNRSPPLSLARTSTEKKSRKIKKQAPLPPVTKESHPLNKPIGDSLHVNENRIPRMSPKIAASQNRSRRVKRPAPPPPVSTQSIGDSLEICQTVPDSQDTVPPRRKPRKLKRKAPAPPTPKLSRMQGLRNFFKKIFKKN